MVKNSGNKDGKGTGIVIVAILAILFGLAEIFHGFSHNFFGIATSEGSFAT